MGKKTKNMSYKIQYIVFIVVTVHYIYANNRIGKTLKEHYFSYIILINSFVALYGCFVWVFCMGVLYGCFFLTFEYVYLFLQSVDSTLYNQLT